MTDEDLPASDLPELSDVETEAVHSVELGLEWLQRAHGDLVEFHHKTGHAMDRLDEAESQLRDCGHEEFADLLRREYLAAGVVDERWTYDLLERFEEGFLGDLTGFRQRVCEEITDGHRHVAERRQHREWTRRAEEE
jgi:oligoribonuclease NrnB/cAMP/cGMP phosphodiesterase (DHH superfamily)